MGAATFMQKFRGDTVQKAFDGATEMARWDHGHAGYSGTLAEKGDFVEITLPKGEDPDDYADKLIRDRDKRIDDKWGPAGAIKVPDEEGLWLFFGWASS